MVMGGSDFKLGVDPITPSRCPLYPRRADLCGAQAYVRFVPIADIPPFKRRQLASTGGMNSLKARWMSHSPKSRRKPQAMTADGLMTAAQAATLKRLAHDAYELDAFKLNLTRTEADIRIAMLTAKLKLLGEPPHTL